MIKKLPGLELGQLLSHPVESPAQRLALAFPSQMDDRRQHAEQHLQLRPGELKMAAEHRDPAVVIQFDQFAVAGAKKMALPVLGRQGQIACDPECPAARQ